MKPGPFFSVITPTYNRAHLIGETVNTILAQEYAGFELLIIDDGSTDNTEEVVKAYGDPRIRYWKKSNGERGAARNFGIKEAKGDYAVLFDSDDLMHPNHLSTLAKYVSDEGGTYQFIATKYRITGPDGAGMPGGTDGRESRWYTLDDLLEGNHFACHFAINLANEGLKLFEEDRAYATMEDWMFLLANLQASPLYLTNEITVSFRHHDERSMNNNERVIEARRRATAWAMTNLFLPAAQQKKLQAYSHYFCAVHYYLEGKAWFVLKEIKDSVKKGGPKGLLMPLALKTIIGKNAVSRLKKIQAGT